MANHLSYVGLQIASSRDISISLMAMPRHPELIPEGLSQGAAAVGPVDNFVVVPIIPTRPTVNKVAACDAPIRQFSDSQ